MVSVVGMYKWCSLAVGRDQKKKKKNMKRKVLLARFCVEMKEKAFLQGILCEGTGLLTAEILPCDCGVGSHAVLEVGLSTCID